MFFSNFSPYESVLIILGLFLLACYLQIIACWRNQMDFGQAAIINKGILTLALLVASYIASVNTFGVEVIQSMLNIYILLSVSEICAQRICEHLFFWHWNFTKKILLLFLVHLLAIGMAGVFAPQLLNTLGLVGAAMTFIASGLMLGQLSTKTSINVWPVFAVSMISRAAFIVLALEISAGCPHLPEAGLFVLKSIQDLAVFTFWVIHISLRLKKIHRAKNTNTYEMVFLD